jgi:hypothetical protein
MQFLESTQRHQGSMRLGAMREIIQHMRLGAMGGIMQVMLSHQCSLRLGAMGG